MSIVKMVELELNIDVNDDISAAIITASMMPLNPIWRNISTSNIVT